MTLSFVILKVKYKTEKMIEGVNEARLTQSIGSDDFVDQFRQHEDDINSNQIDFFILTSGDDNEGEHGKEGTQLFVFDCFHTYICSLVISFNHNSDPTVLEYHHCAKVMSSRI